ncbi:hypothetical protein CCHR01_16800 [Colletotrichum chrysophilum]|uniref:Uncharacterized protein n=1 Tax=Colletotrichum chrysophilum TaxID=1836956 RepID=A0AAD9A351_9PEZI|nr:hypothetical protein CCHR01_16800 [Colletotrichum chrysophilum]
MVRNLETKSKAEMHRAPCSERTAKLRSMARGCHADADGVGRGFSIAKAPWDGKAGVGDSVRRPAKPAKRRDALSALAANNGASFEVSIKMLKIQLPEMTWDKLWHFPLWPRRLPLPPTQYHTKEKLCLAGRRKPRDKGTFRERPATCEEALGMPIAA